MHNEQPRSGTLAVWAGEDEYLWQGATQVPVVHSVSFGYEDVDHWLRVTLGQGPGHVYARNTSPTVCVFEEKIRILGATGRADLMLRAMSIPIRQHIDEPCGRNAFLGVSCQDRGETDDTVDFARD